MLDNLYIKNVGLIENAELSFGRGLNILSGETGAGKSMVMDSIGFALGERGGKDFVRQGCDKAVVEAVFSVDEKNFTDIFELFGLDYPENGEILITRTASSDGKTTNRVNGRTVTVSMLKELSARLMDIHGQHQHQSLLNPAKHITLLDKFCPDEIVGLKEKLHELLTNLKAIQKDMDSIYTDEEEKNRRIDMLSFQVDEINQAKLKPDEEDELNEQKTVLSNSEKILRNSVNAVNYLYDGSENESSLSDLLSRALSCVEYIAGIDERVNEYYEQLANASAVIDDASIWLKHYAQNLESDSGRLDEIEQRLDTIYNLKRKYGPTVEAILEFGAKKQRELDLLLNSQQEMERLLKLKNSVLAEVSDVCKKISSIRQKTAQVIQNKIENELHDLEMKNARFEILISQKNEPSFEGMDRVEFMISPNLGSELKPLSKIASGGEMSRVMLALKNVMADADTIDTFIFDEIDTGVSGRTAQKVGEKMSLVAKKHQIICITHLPQIAAMADTHFLIEKKSLEDTTFTNVFELDKKGSIDEIARLMGGAEMTEATYKAADEMKKLGDKIKAN